MNLRNIRWPVVVTTMAVALALFFGAGFVMKLQLVEQPLKDLYASSDQVESFEVLPDQPVQVIQVKLKESGSLADTYRSLDEATARVLKSAPYRLEVTDHRTPQLEERLRRFNLYVQEALSTGQFAAMADRMETEAKDDGLTALLEVDSAHLYLTLTDGHGGYLYSITHRAGQAPAVKVEGGAGL